METFLSVLLNFTPINYFIKSSNKPAMMHQITPSSSNNLYVPCINLNVCTLVLAQGNDMKLNVCMLKCS